MEELIKLVELVRQEAPKARVKVDSLMVTHYFTIEELLNICNKYADYKCALADVVGRSEQHHCEFYDFGRRDKPCNKQCYGCKAMNLD